MTLTTIIAFFLLPLLAGALVKVLRPEAKWLRLLLSFSGAFLLGVVFLHMLPELYEEEGGRIGVWVLGGFLLQVVLEFFSHGIEHGHMHFHAGKALPVVTLASLCLHSYAEGIPFADPEVAGDIPFLVGVLLHKMPMAIALARHCWSGTISEMRPAACASTAPMGSPPSSICIAFDFPIARISRCV